MIWVAKNLYFFNCLLDGAHTILYISYNFHFLIFRHVYILTIIFGFVHIFIGIFQKNKLQHINATAYARIFSLLQQFFFNPFSCPRSLFIHLLREAKHGYTGNIVTAHLRCKLQISCHFFLYFTNCTIYVKLCRLLTAKFQSVLK